MASSRWRYLCPPENCRRMRRTYLMSVASELLGDGEFAAWLETLCKDSETQWRAAVDSAGRLLWIAVRPGLLKDILSPRGTACRCQDGLSLRIFFRIDRLGKLKRDRPSRFTKHTAVFNREGNPQQRPGRTSIGH